MHLFDGVALDRPEDERVDALVAVQGGQVVDPALGRPARKRWSVPSSVMVPERL
ncbi:hypothetical protein [Nocardia sp. NPDC004604]|uniref:hypothetical protein n=1 Tax=Nocardia sp. NPDC004604 TaxID=3157013 RepID=UPI0033B2DB84